MSIKKPSIGSTDTASAPAREISPYIIDSMDSASLDATNFRREWLVRDILVRNQAAVIGGPKKCLKTSLVVEMAVSLGTGTPFLGRFPVNNVRRTAVFSGESDPASIQETARRVCRAHQVKMANVKVDWVFRLPHLSDRRQLQKLGAFLTRHKVEVVFIDPLYLCLLAGAKGASASNLFDVGPLLHEAARTCLDAGATPVFVHHTTKTASKRKEDDKGPMDLDALAFAGIAEFARQWILVNRREVYEPGKGRHELELISGGSSGHSGRWNLDIEEGVIDANFAGRAWDVQISEPTEKPPINDGSRPGVQSAPKEQARVEKPSKTKRNDSLLDAYFE